MTPIPKPTPVLREPKKLKSKPHVIAPAVRFDTFAEWGTTCLWCEMEGGALDLHHVRRRSQGGADHKLNLRPVHRLCHEYIHQHPSEAKARGFLA